MAAMLGSKLTVLAQMGSTIAIGLLLDTLIVRSLLMPSIATLLGRWFWWPQVVHPRGDNYLPRTRPPTAAAPTPAPTPTPTPRLSRRRDRSGCIGDVMCISRIGSNRLRAASSTVRR